MSFPEQDFVSLQEFYKMRENTERILEYIDG
ncbi:Uma2 family endonuclease, partial [Parageobacillus sp. SY1]